MASQSQVESELAKLKQEVGSGDEPKQLEGGGRAMLAIHAVPPTDETGAEGRANGRG